MIKRLFVGQFMDRCQLLYLFENCFIVSVKQSGLQYSGIFGTVKGDFCPSSFQRIIAIGKQSCDVFKDKIVNEVIIFLPVVFDRTLDCFQ